MYRLYNRLWFSSEKILHEIRKKNSSTVFPQARAEGLTASRFVPLVLLPSCSASLWKFLCLAPDLMPTPIHMFDFSIIANCQTMRVDMHVSICNQYVGQHCQGIMVTCLSVCHHTEQEEKYQAKI